ncbi:hypothetical protein EBR66_07045 [bacterium]|nr:hypothetical protein [bacterium]
MKRQYGGNLGQSYTFGAPIVPGLGNAATVVPQSSCMAATRFGMIPTPQTGLGLPGMKGGFRKRTKGRKGKKTHRQRGGRYSFDLTNPVPGAAAPWAGGIPQVMRIPCESAVANPMNPRQMGGAQGDVAFYAAPTAGYTNTPSTWLGSTGAPSMLQTPYDARSMPSVCTKTGGGSRRKGSRRKHKGKGTRRR